MIVAVVLLAIAATASLEWLVESTHAVTRSQVAEQRILAASRFLDHVVLWSPVELAQRLGTHEQGPFLLSVSAVGGCLFRIAVTDSTRRNHPLVETVVCARTRAHDER